MAKKEYTPEQIAVIEKKQEGWKKQGNVIARGEFYLSGELNKINSTVDSLVPTKDNVVTIEAEVKKLNELQKNMNLQRLKVTSPMNEKIKYLIQYEKDAADKISTLKSTLLSVKKDIKKEQDEIKRKEQQKIDFGFTIDSTYDRLKVDIEAHVENVVATEYAKMLTSKMLLQDFDGKVKEVCEKSNFPTIAERMAAASYDVSLLSKDEVNAIKREKKRTLLNPTELLLSRFADKKVVYESELRNVEEALRIQEAEKKEREKKAKQEERALELQNNIEKKEAEKASEALVDKIGKDLKEKYEVDMEESPESALYLFAAFQAHFDEVVKLLNVKKWLELKPKQIAVALGRMKTKDNNLKIGNITFKKVENL